MIEEVITLDKLNTICLELLILFLVVISIILITIYLVSKVRKEVK